MEKQDIKEFIEDDGTLINSKMKPNLNRQAMSKQTTDQHVATSRQGMVWMNYRRFYGEADETLPYTKEADKHEVDPESFFKFLSKQGKQDDFSKYFVKKEEKAETVNATKVLKETQRNKMRDLVEDLVTKKHEPREFVKKQSDDKPTVDELRVRETALFTQIDAIIKKIDEAFPENDEKDVVIDYITQMVM